MTLAYDYAAAARRAEWAFADALDDWTHGLFAFAAPFHEFPSIGAIWHFDPAEAIELQFKFLKRLLKVNFEYARQLAAATHIVTGAVRQHIEGLSSAVLEQVQSVPGATTSGIHIPAGAAR